MREFIDGSTAIVRGALDAGCDFFAGYPITPASPILMMMLRELPKVGGIGIQAEDEIASMGMCIGATLTGRKALTATSGPGISLYSEHVGLAIMGEVPLVIVDVQRLGPATGAATTTGQGDVQFVRWGTAGGYPIIALAPSSVAECYHLTVKAFELAERFRCPVFLMTDKELNLTMATVSSDAVEQGSPVERPCRDGATEDRPIVPYRYEPAANVVPLAHYGDGAPVRFTGSSHDENAYITKDPETVERLNRHLAAKIEEHRDEIELVELDADEGADTLVISYGSTAGAVREAVRIARREGRKLSALTIHSIWPVPETAIARALEGVERVVVAELNLGQYRREIERLAGNREVRGVHRIDGELIAPVEILEAAA
jgi:2-oxoglutarate ferredoxin oxidoreductase subunit alpha